VTVTHQATVLVSAGEPSGDAHGACLVAALKRAQPGLELEGCGGPLMAGAGVRLRRGIEGLAAMGLLEIARAIPRHWSLLRDLVRDAETGRFRLAILIDYPGFHLRLGAALRARGVPVLQYIAPQLWAWHGRRIGRLRRSADRVAAILPFEQEWFAARGVQCSFVGHPLLDRRWPSQADARAALSLAPGATVLAIFPGSRNAEISLHWPLFREVARRLLAEGRCDQVLVAGTAQGHYPDPGDLRVVRGAADQVMAAATAALVKSGTTSLEAACVGTPLVVAYRTRRTTYEVVSRMLTVDQISLVNLVLGEALVPEFWRRPVVAAPILAALRLLLEPASANATAQRLGFKRARERLGAPGVADRVARLALDLVPV